MNPTLVVALFGCAAAFSVNTELQAAKIFGRFADKKMLLDVPGAGTPELRNCCHGGCDNCDYSHIFDEMNAGRPKWICLYPHRELIDGRRHEPTWASIFEKEEEAISSSQFFERLCQLPFRPSMGPKCKIPSDELPDAKVVDALYEKLLADGAETLTARDFARGLRKLTGEEHGATWKHFSPLFEA